MSGQASLAVKLAQEYRVHLDVSLKFVLLNGSPDIAAAWISAHTAAMEVFQRVVLQLFLLCEILFCLSAVVAGSDQEHCSVPAPNDEDTDPCPPWFIQQEIADDNTTVQCSCGTPTHGVVCDPCKNV